MEDGSNTINMVLTNPIFDRDDRILHGMMRRKGRCLINKWMLSQHSLFLFDIWPISNYFQGGSSSSSSNLPWGANQWKDTFWVVHHNCGAHPSSFQIGAHEFLILPTAARWIRRFLLAIRVSRSSEVSISWCGPFCLFSIQFMSRYSRCYGSSKSPSFLSTKRWAVRNLVYSPSSVYRNKAWSNLDNYEITIINRGRDHNSRNLQAVTISSSCCVAWR